MAEMIHERMIKQKKKNAAKPLHGHKYRKEKVRDGSVRQEVEASVEMRMLDRVAPMVIFKQLGNGTRDGDEESQPERKAKLETEIETEI